MNRDQRGTFTNTHQECVKFSFIEFISTYFFLWFYMLISVHADVNNVSLKFYVIARFAACGAWEVEQLIEALKLKKS